jgi:hypothetical protein
MRTVIIILILVIVILSISGVAGGVITYYKLFYKKLIPVMQPMPPQITTITTPTTTPTTPTTTTTPTTPTTTTLPPCNLLNANQGDTEAVEAVMPGVNCSGWDFGNI